MTPEELKEYEQLSPMLKDFYNMGMRSHPEWSHAQAHTYATICGITGESIPPIGGDRPPITEIFRQVLIKADTYMAREFPRIYSQVKGYFSKAIDWLKTAVNVTINKIMDFFK